jgi:hypothetical protein
MYRTVLLLILVILAISLYYSYTILYNFIQSGNSEYWHIGLCTNLNDPPDDGNVKVPKCV